MYMCAHVYIYIYIHTYMYEEIYGSVFRVEGLGAGLLP